MNGAELVKNLQAYYGVKYTEVEQPIVSSWIKAEFAKYGPDHLDKVWEQVTTDVSKNYGKVPDKALLNEAAVKVRPVTNKNALPPVKALEAPVLAGDEAQQMYEAELAIRATFAKLGAPLSEDRMNDHKAQWSKNTVGDRPSILAQARQEALSFDFEVSTGGGGSVDPQKIKQNESSQDQGGLKNG